MIYAVSFVVLLSAVLYWAYKKFREAPYQPGMVAKFAQENPESFDNEELHSQTTDKHWKMPKDVDIFYFQPSKSPPVSDSSRRPVIALHGGPSMSPEEPWKLCQDVPDVYLYHARGCGHSTRIFREFPTKGMWPGMKILEEELGIAAQVADVERIRRRLVADSDKDKKIDLVGHSFGGLIATMYATEFPQNVRSLTLLVPASVLRMPSKEKHEDLFALVGDKIREHGNDKDVEEYEAYMKKYLDFSTFPQETDETLAQRQGGFAKFFALAAGGLTDGKAVMSKTEQSLIGGMACYATFLSMGFEHDWVPVCKERLANSTFPVSLVHGAGDIVPESSTRGYLELFPPDNLMYEVVPGESHFIFSNERATQILQETMRRAA